MVESSKAVFLDRDGVIVRGRTINNKLYAPRDINFFYYYPKVLNNLNNLKKLGFKLFIITNQPDLGNNQISSETLSKMHSLITNDLPIDKIYMCGHSQKANCKCRKPKPYLIRKASIENNINLSKSYLIGDRWSDIKAGYDSGCRNIFINRYYKEKLPNEQIKTVYSLAGAVRYIISMN